MPEAITCTRCGGAGHTFLSTLSEKTLRLLRRKGEATGAELARIYGCKPTAMNNRLKYLQRCGLATSRRDGRLVFYRPSK